MRKRWTGQVIAASFSSHARGVIIFLHKSISYQILQTICDPAGRYIIIRGTSLSKQFNLIHVYGPNKDDSKFFNDLFLNLSTLPGNYIVAEDFNCTLDPVKNRNSDSNYSQT